MKTSVAPFALLCIVMLGSCDAPLTSMTSTPSPAPAPGPPSPPPSGEYPQAPTVDVPTLAEILPKDANGKPVLLEVGGVALTLGPGRKDAIGAHARCVDATVACVTKTKDLDRCIAEVPRCSTAEPWNEEPRCCPEACVAAYQEERRLGASPLQADAAVFGSTHECFPGLVELYRSYGGTPRRMPRRAP